MINIFFRSKLNPILKPNPVNAWENFKLYNPGAIYHNGKYHLFYRAVGKDRNWQSRIGYAVSEDGEVFRRSFAPLLSGDNFFEKRGMEDPRISRVGNIFYMAYAAYDGITPRLSIAASKNLITWQKHGPCLNNFNFEKYGGVFKSRENGKIVNRLMPYEWSKSGGIFPQKIKGRYLMLFGEHRIWLAGSKNGLNWSAEKPTFLGPRKNHFDNAYVEMGPPPIKTDRGWLIIYHGIDEGLNYRLGFLLTDPDKPRRIIYRSREPIFEPEKPYEIAGLPDIMPGGIKKEQSLKSAELKKYKNKAENARIVFCCGAVLRGGTLRIYYGAGDLLICTAAADIKDILSLVDKS